MTQSRLPILLFCLVTALCLALIACGGGGGGDDGSGSIEAAQVDINVQPNNIDPGDRTLVTIHVSNVHEDGILLKVRFPLGLSYVSKTGTFRVDDEELTLTPDFNVSDSTYTYLVFLFAQSDFGKEGKDQATITFQLQGISSPVTGLVEVDATIKDPSLSDSEQFSVSNPLFGAKDSDDISVGQSSTTPTTTP